jgi:very-short-patch-repair endonuclease
VDFYCKDLQLAIEVDGITHHDDAQVKKDLLRQLELEKWGVQFLRFNALDIVHDISNALRAIEHWIIEYEEKNGGAPEHVLRKRNRTR